MVSYHLVRMHIQVQKAHLRNANKLVRFMGSPVALAGLLGIPQSRLVGYVWLSIFDAAKMRRYWYLPSFPSLVEGD